MQCQNGGYFSACHWTITTQLSPEENESGVSVARWAATSSSAFSGSFLADFLTEAPPTCGLPSGGRERRPPTHRYHSPSKTRAHVLELLFRHRPEVRWRNAVFGGCLVGRSDPKQR